MKTTTDEGTVTYTTSVLTDHFWKIENSPEETERLRIETENRVAQILKRELEQKALKEQEIKKTAEDEERVKLFQEFIEKDYNYDEIFKIAIAAHKKGGRFKTKVEEYIKNVIIEKWSGKELAVKLFNSEIGYIYAEDIGIIVENMDFEYSQNIGYLETMIKAYGKMIDPKPCITKLYKQMIEKYAKKIIARAGEGWGGIIYSLDSIFKYMLHNEDILAILSEKYPEVEIPWLTISKYDTGKIFEIYDDILSEKDSTSEIIRNMISEKYNGFPKFLSEAIIQKGAAFIYIKKNYREKEDINWMINGELKGYTDLDYRKLSGEAKNIIRKFISQLFLKNASYHKLDTSKTWEENEYEILLNVENYLNKNSKWSEFKGTGFNSEILLHSYEMNKNSTEMKEFMESKKIEFRGLMEKYNEILN